MPKATFIAIFQVLLISFQDYLLWLLLLLCIIIIIVCVCGVQGHIHVCAPVETRGVARWGGFWEPSLGPLPEQQVLLTAEHLPSPGVLFIPKGVWLDHRVEQTTEVLLLLPVSSFHSQRGIILEEAGGFQRALRLPMCYCFRAQPETSASLELWFFYMRMGITFCIGEFDLSLSKMFLGHLSF